MSFANSLPRPTRMWEMENKIQMDGMNNGIDILSDPNKFCPPYGNRRNWIPRSDSDFGDGGAYPEVHVAQYPLDMGAVVERKNNEKTLTVKLSESGNIKYDSIAKNGHGSNKIVYTNIIQLLPGETLPKNDELKKPNIETLTETTEMTRRALEKLTSQKINAAMPCRQAASSNVTQYLRYTPLQQGDEFNSGAKQRVIKMVEAQIDPMEPPKFKINKKIPRGPPSPPAPVLHSPSRKVSMKEQKEWKVPPCISNWKNAKGYTIPLDKRLAADGRGLQQLHINEKFAKMAEALYIADRKAREAVEARAQLEKKLAQKEKEKKEDMLRVMAQKARDERAGLRFSEDVESNEIRERDELRAERHKDRMREKNLSRAAPDKRLKLQRERERDITEQIALGKSAKLSANSESQFDQRLFNTTKGMDSGYGDDEGYNVYDKPWRDSASLSTHLHRPKKDVDNEIYGTDYTKLNITNKFVPDKEFSGAERSAQSQRNGPVQFEKEDDPFGLDQFLNMAKKATKRSDGAEDKVSEHKRQKL